MFVPYIIRRSTNYDHYTLILPLLHFIYWLLHVSAVACHHMGASQILLRYLKYKSNIIYNIRGLFKLYRTLIFPAQTNQSPEVTIIVVVEGKFLHMHKFFPAYRKR
jgi:hypothetical protein